MKRNLHQVTSTFIDFSDYFGSYKKLPVSRNIKKLKVTNSLSKNQDKSACLPVRKKQKAKLPKLDESLFKAQADQAYKSRKRRYNSVSDLKMKKVAKLENPSTFENSSWMDKTIDLFQKPQQVINNFQYQLINYENMLQKAIKEKHSSSSQIQCANNALSFLIQNLKPYCGVLQKVQQIFQSSEVKQVLEDLDQFKKLYQYKKTVKISQKEIKALIKQTSQMESQIKSQKIVIKQQELEIDALKIGYDTMNQKQQHKIKLLSDLIKLINSNGIPIMRMFSSQIPEETVMHVLEIIGQRKNSFLQSLAWKLRKNMNDSEEPFNFIAKTFKY